MVISTHVILNAVFINLFVSFCFIFENNFITILLINGYSSYFMAIDPLTLYSQTSTVLYLKLKCMNMNMHGCNLNDAVTLRLRYSLGSDAHTAVFANEC